MIRPRARKRAITGSFSMRGFQKPKTDVKKATLSSLHQKIEANEIRNPQRQNEEALVKAV
jgi:hypothetical protein